MNSSRNKVANRDWDLLAVTKLSHDAVHRVVLDEYIKDQFLLRHPVILIRITRIRNTKTSRLSINSHLSVWLPVNKLRPQVVKLLTECLICGPNLHTSPLRLQINSPVRTFKGLQMKTYCTMHNCKRT